MERGFLDTLSLLKAVVVEQAEGIATQESDGRQVSSRQKSHEEVNDVPHQFETGQCPKYHHHST